MKRFYDDKLQGVTQPSQRRYVHYFEDMLAGKVVLDAPYVINHVPIVCVCLVSVLLLFILCTVVVYFLSLFVVVPRICLLYLSLCLLYLSL